MFCGERRIRFRTNSQKWFAVAESMPHSATPVESAGKRGQVTKFDVAERVGDIRYVLPLLAGLFPMALEMVLDARI